MRKEDFFEVLGDLDDDIVKRAKTSMKKKLNWKTWGGIAACLCLVVGAAATLWQNNSPAGGPSIPGSGDSGGGTEGGMYSVAVYPASESEENVDTSDVVSLTESEALDNPLAEHLPRQLPENFHYGRGSVYNTVMKDGTQYNMLRVEYITGEIPEQKFTEDGGAIAPDPEAIGELFTICVFNYEPITDISIYSDKEEITESLLEESGAVYIHFEDCYIGVFAETAEPASVLDVLRNIE